MSVYVSVDIESDGPIPGDNSMLSVGAAAYAEDGELLDTFTINLLPLSEAHQDKSTMKFWKRNPEAWDALQKDRVKPDPGMHTFAAWARKFNETLVYIGYPVAFDFGFTHWYFHHFLGSDPFGFSGLDLKTYAMSLLGTEYSGTTKRTMPREWFNNELKHEHVALGDAIEQGALFFSMREYHLKRVARLGGSQM